MLVEARARIDHPEDIIFDENGVDGARRALAALMHTADQHQTSATIKWDGSPAVIFGWIDNENFVLTDKAGIGAKKYEGRPTSADAVTAMIYNRKPDQQGRAEYAATFGPVYELLKQATPKSTRGRMIQGDMLWMSPADLQQTDEEISFRPNKVNYHIDAGSDLGKRIKRSVAGIAIHGVYPSAVTAGEATAEPTPTTPTDLKMKNVSGLIIFGPETNIGDEVTIRLPKERVAALKKMLDSPAAKQIDRFLDPFAIGALKIANLPDIFKSFLAWKAGQGQDGLKNAAQEFVDWVQSPASKLTASKQQNVLAHINQFRAAYQAIWKIASGLVEIKHAIKDQLDRAAAAAGGGVTPKQGHEGFVSATPHGKIKLVNRPVFMKKA